MNRFVLIIPQCLPATQQIVTRHVVSQGAAYWHWSPDVWLLSFPASKTSVAVRDELGRLLPGVQNIVVRFDDPNWDWAGFGPPEWTNWFRQSWESR